MPDTTTTIQFRTWDKKVVSEAKRRGLDVQKDKLNSRAGVDWWIIRTHKEADQAFMRQLLERPPITR